MSSDPPILVIGNSDGIGLATTRALLKLGRPVIGLSRSDSPLCENAPDLPASYRHNVCDVTEPNFSDELRSILLENPDLRCVIHCAGVGSGFDPGDLSGELACFRTNLLSVVELAAVVIPAWRKSREEDAEGEAARPAHLVVLSSVADSFVVSEAPSYGASKVGLSRYLRALGIRVAREGIAVSNIRVGFVDTKMAQADVKPFQISVERAAKVVLEVLERRPPVCTRPRIVACIAPVVAEVQRAQLFFAATIRGLLGRGRG